MAADEPEPARHENALRHAVSPHGLTRTTFISAVNVHEGSRGPPTSTYEIATRPRRIACHSSVRMAPGSEWGVGPNSANDGSEKPVSRASWRQEAGVNPVSCEKS